MGGEVGVEPTSSRCDDEARMVRFVEAPTTFGPLGDVGGRLRSATYGLRRVELAQAPLEDEGFDEGNHGVLMMRMMVVTGFECCLYEEENSEVGRGGFLCPGRHARDEPTKVQVTYRKGRVRQFQANY